MRDRPNHELKLCDSAKAKLKDAPLPDVFAGNSHTRIKAHGVVGGNSVPVVYIDFECVAR